MKRHLLVLAISLAAVSFLTVHNAGAQCPEDPNDLGECDTLHVETFDCDRSYEAEAGSFDSVRVAIYVTHDSNTFWFEPYGWAQDSIRGFVIPLKFWNQPPGCADSVILPEWDNWNNTYCNPYDSRMNRSIYRDLVDEYTGDTVSNRMLRLASQGQGLEWSTVLDIESHSSDGDSGHAMLAVIPTMTTSRAWWEGDRALLATYTFHVYMSEDCDTTEVWVDSTFWPPANRLVFSRQDAVTYIPRHYLPVADTIYEEFAECEWISFDGSPPQTPPDVEVIGCDPSQTVLCITVHGMCVRDTVVGDDAFKLITVPEMVSTPEDGRPQLPAIGEMIGLSTLADTVMVTDISTSAGLTFEDVHVFPLQQETESEYEPPFAMDTSFYSDSNYFYPPSVAEAGPVGFWHILPTSNLGIFPFLYNPVTDTLIVYDTICVTLSHTGPPVTDTIPRSFAVIYEALTNHGCVFQNVERDMEKFKAHELFIIADDLAGDPSVEKLIQYKKKKGFNCASMTTTQAGGTGTADQKADSIKKTIEEFYNRPECCDKPKYVTLIGDHPEVPAKVSDFGLTAGSGGLGPNTDILSDEWYELVKGDDYKPDVMLGRLPTKDPTTLSKIINKKIKNDTTAHAGVDKILLVASKGDARFKRTKEQIRKKLEGAGFTVITAYGSDGATNAHVTAAIDGGVGQVNYVGHGSPTAWWHWAADSSSWTKTEVSSLQDSCREPIVWAITCNNNRIDHPGEDCIGEAWIKECKATAAFGASRTAPAGQSFDLDKFIAEAESTFKTKCETTDLGHIIMQAKASLDGKYDAGGRGSASKRAKRAILEYLLLGDPDQTKWKAPPKQPDVGHQSSIPAGPQEFTVTVQSEGSPVEGAIVTLWKEGVSGDEVFESRYTDASGEATFNIDPQTAGVMYVTVWGKNLKVYFGEVLVYVGGVPCDLVQDQDTPAYYFDSFAANDAVAKYFDPGVYCDPPAYPYKIHDVEFYLYDFAGVGSVDIRIDVHRVDFDSCDGPGTQIYLSEPITVTTFYPDWVHLDLPEQVCVHEPFFISIEYASGVTGSTPSFLFDDDVYPCDTCHAWVWFESQGYSPPWWEWSDFWTPPVPGCPILRVTGFTQHPDCAYLCGDCNGDGIVDVGDVIYLIGYLYIGSSPPDPLCVGDANCDGVVDGGDVIYLINYLFLGTSPPCPECCDLKAETEEVPIQKIERFFPQERERISDQAIKRDFLQKKVVPQELPRELRELKRME